MLLEPYRDYDSLHQILDSLDETYQGVDLDVHQVVSILIQRFPQWAIEEMVSVDHSSITWYDEAKLFHSLLKTEAHKMYPSNKAFL